MIVPAWPAVMGDDLRPRHAMRGDRDGSSEPERIVGAFSGRIFNPVLITLALIYVLWSWVHLPSSIWVRCLFACSLAMRMKPDVIIPFVLSCVQLKLQLAGRGTFDESQDLARQLTGYEQYAFILPTVTFFVRTLMAAVSAKAARRATFPFWLYGLYLAAMPFVVAGAVAAYGESGWTSGIRDYFVVGVYFYGLLMPGCSRKQLMQLVVGFTVIGLLTILGNLLVGMNSRQLWVLLPVAGSFAPLTVLGRGRLPTVCLALAYSILGAVSAVQATFTLVLLWTWNTFAGLGLGLFGWRGLRKTVVTGMSLALLLMTLSVFFVAAFTHDPTRELFEAVRGGQGSTYDRMTFKLLSDRGPIWWGAMCYLAENGSACGVPSPKFYIRSLSRAELWPYSTHSILLDPLLRLGYTAGPVLLLILLHSVIISCNAIARDADIAIGVLGLAVISNIVLGGATLPYMLNERASEHLHMVAGLLGVYGLGRQQSPQRRPQPAAHARAVPHPLPAT
ncbi:MAG: hypothetical protein ACKO6B_11380 [Planctomycetia bacterium]